MTQIRRRLLKIAAALLVLGVVIALLAYEVIPFDWDSFMERQVSVGWQEAPRRSPPVGAVAFDAPAYLDDAANMTNPVPADDIALQRGEILFAAACAVCHGPRGEGDGSIVAFFRPEGRAPAVLTDARLGLYPDATLYLIIHQGFGAMPPIRENLDERSHWDVIHYFRTLQSP
jgi:mono/diheme cytochrome c family protein